MTHRTSGFATGLATEAEVLGLSPVATEAQQLKIRDLVPCAQVGAIILGYGGLSLYEAVRGEKRADALVRWMQPGDRENLRAFLIPPPTHTHTHTHTHTYPVENPTHTPTPHTPTPPPIGPRQCAHARVSAGRPGLSGVGAGQESTSLASGCSSALLCL